jgi:hypothetical protein
VPEGLKSITKQDLNDYDEGADWMDADTPSAWTATLSTSEKNRSGRIEKKGKVHSHLEDYLAETGNYGMVTMITMVTMCRCLLTDTIGCSVVFFFDVPEKNKIRIRMR